MSNDDPKPLTPEEVDGWEIYCYAALSLDKNDAKAINELRLIATLRQAWQERDRLKELNANYVKDRKRLKEQIRDMRAALEWYADPGRYMDNYKDGTPMISDVADDDGEKAREALAQCDKMKGDQC